MILPGHIALAIMGRTLFGLDLSKTVAATLAPDVVDKSASHILGITPGGRYAMHSLSGWAACTCLVGLMLGKTWARAWAWGHLLHILGDGRDVPWLLPFKQYEYPPRFGFGDLVLGIVGSEEGQKNLRKEFLFLALSLLALAGRRVVQSPKRTQ